ncbi:MAG: RagB/SusD family nutrient uptake outer membrane protein [Bacteroides sp.]|nr:RagB/SusD family nutrient uptake outer membrane protein [Bacteroides sp.]MCM1094875.1 RagB/SusD family nutrient uptake outer membrane protein [Terasakiella sp.]
MKVSKYIAMVGIAAVTAAGFSSCTDLDETVYDQITGENFYNKKDDVIHAVFRPFEHIYWSHWQIMEHEELPGDQIVTCYRHDWWQDGNKWVLYHRHQMDDINQNSPDRGEWTSEWSYIYQGISQANFAISELNRLDPARFNFTQDEWDALRGQLYAIRAYCYQRLFNAYRNIVIQTEYKSAEDLTVEEQTQVEPAAAFEWIERELYDCLELLPVKQGNGGNGIMQGQFTKGAAAALLVRHYLNAEAWIGVPMWDKCSAMCDRIMSGEFGHYEIDSDWYGPYDWDNETSPEVIFAFPGSFATTSWVYNNARATIYGRSLPYGCQNYLGIQKDGSRNPRYCISPSYDNSNPRSPLQYKLGCVSQKFEKYSSLSPDARWKQYRNTSNNTREGMMFLEGYIPDPNTASGHAASPNGYDVYLRDQIGMFTSGAPSGTITSPSQAESRLENGDFNSGLFVMKYPWYPYDGGAFKESDYVVLRYAEIVYSKAECLLRSGESQKAGALLNGVRKRNYLDKGLVASVAYKGSDSGLVNLDLDEMLDEWGREFLFEARRRTDLIRFGRFQDAWWDKPADVDKHYEIFPLSSSQMAQNPYLVQNPGYPTVR